MYISLKWVQKVFALKNLSFPKFCEKLTLAGFEIEEIQKKSILGETDFILDVSLTANRSDLFNIKSFTRELNSIFLQEKAQDLMESSYFSSLPSSIFKASSLQIKPFIWEHFLQKRNFSFISEQKNKKLPFEKCYSFVSLESTSVKVGSSPQWLQKALLGANRTPVNNIIDTLNFTTLETGYPFFVCDLRKIKQKVQTSQLSFSVRSAFPQQTFAINTEKTFILQPSNLVVYINEIPLAVLGLVMAEEFEVDANTTEILIYTALIDPIEMRKSSQALGIRTEQSICFEKNLNFNGFEQAWNRLMILFRVQGIDLVEQPKIYQMQPLQKSSFLNYIRKARPKVKVTYREIRDLVGQCQDLSKERILKILNALYFDIVSACENECELYVPFSRETDLERSIDIIEEIIRINGLTSFTSQVPGREKIGQVSKLEKLKRLLRKTFIELGFNEVFHYSLTTKNTSQQIELQNPIVPETSFFRGTLLTQLIQKADQNQKQKNKVFEAFEIGRVYSLSKAGTIVEREVISGIFGGQPYRSDWNEEEKVLTWFEAKGFLEQVFSILGLCLEWAKFTNQKSLIFHPKRSAELYLNNRRVGFFGQLHPQQAKTYSFQRPLFLFELDLNILEFFWKPNYQFKYKPYSMFPTYTVDIACLKKDTIFFKEVQMKVRELAGPLLESMELFDYYGGAPIPKGFHNLGLKLKFRKFEGTLTTDEVERIVATIIRALQQDFEIQIRQ